MRTYLRPGVHMCLVDEGAIFLDLSANTYLGIEAATKAALVTCLVGLDAPQSSHTSGQQAELPVEVTALVRRGLLTDSSARGRSFTPLILSITHAVPFGVGRPSIRIGVQHLVRFVSALLRTSIMLRRGHLLALVTRLLARKASILPASRMGEAHDVVTLVHIVRRLSALFYTSKDACLLDSFVLAEFLISYGYRPTLVLGVHTKPFLAHAWVQMDDCVLNDSMEYAQTLTPIAAL